VERELKVAIEPAKKAFLPGEKADVKITVTDQTGKPVRAELSLALVNEALYAVCPDTTPSILEFFQKDARRFAEFHTGATCGFRYVGTTRKVATAVTDEKGRLERAANQVMALQEQQGQPIGLDVSGNPGNRFVHPSPVSPEGRALPRLEAGDKVDGFDFEGSQRENSPVDREQMFSFAVVKSQSSSGLHLLEVHPTLLRVYFQNRCPSVSYELAGYVPGAFKILPCTIREIGNPKFLSVGQTPELTVLAAVDYTGNLYLKNDEIQRDNNRNWNMQRRQGPQKGVQIQKAY
jgi:hypothetical protein